MSEENLWLKEIILTRCYNFALRDEKYRSQSAEKLAQIKAELAKRIEKNNALLRQEHENGEEKDSNFEDYYVEKVHENNFIQIQDALRPQLEEYKAQNEIAANDLIELMYPRIET